MDTRRPLDLGDTYALPFATRVTRWLNRGIFLLLANPVALTVWGIVGAVVTSVIVTERARAAHGLWSEIALVALYVVLFFALAVVLRHDIQGAGRLKSIKRTLVLTASGRGTSALVAFCDTEEDARGVDALCDADVAGRGRRQAAERGHLRGLD